MTTLEDIKNGIGMNEIYRRLVQLHPIEKASIVLLVGGLIVTGSAILSSMLKIYDFRSDLVPTGMCVCFFAIVLMVSCAGTSKESGG